MEQKLIHFLRGINTARRATFTTLIVANLGLILINRSWSHTLVRTLGIPNTVLWSVFVGASAFLGLVLYTPILRELFRFAPLPGVDIVICLVAGAISLRWFEGFKILRRSRHDGGGQ